MMFFANTPCINAENYFAGKSAFVVISTMPTNPVRRPVQGMPP